MKEFISILLLGLFCSCGSKVTFSIPDNDDNTDSSIGGVVTHINIEDAAGGGSEITTSTLLSGSTLNLYAVSRDTNNNFVADVVVTWSVDNAIGTFSASSGSSTVFTATNGGTGTITGDHASITDDTSGIITVFSCPTGYIVVPANTIVGAPDPFCVMKYEAKNDGGGNAVSTATVVPWASINQTNAWNECDLLNSEAPTRADIDNDTGGDGTYALVSNPEWLAIARNVENVDANWTDSAVGAGCLKRGNVGGTLPCTGGNSGYNGPDPDSGSGRSDNGTAQLTLNNGEVIWDLSGNVWEWVDWTLGGPLSTNMSQVSKPYNATDASPQPAWRELDVIDTFSILAPNTSILPSDPTLNTSYGIGGYYAGTSGGAAIRGGHVTSLVNAGAFALLLNYASSYTLATIGFRCVFRVR